MKRCCEINIFLHSRAGKANRSQTMVACERMRDYRECRRCKTSGLKEKFQVINDLLFGYKHLSVVNLTNFGRKSKILIRTFSEMKQLSLILLENTRWGKEKHTMAVAEADCDGTTFSGVNLIDEYVICFAKRHCAQSYFIKDK